MSSQRAGDLTGRPLSFFLAWGIPMAAIVLLNFFDKVLPLAASVLIIFGALVWAAVACLLNAGRCGRRHCYFSGPILLASALAALLFGFNVVPPGPAALNVLLWSTIVLVALTFVPELMWGRYVQPREKDPRR